MPDLIEHERSGKRRMLPNWSPLAKAHPDQVLTFFEWVQLNHISPSTGRRIIRRGEIVVTQLTKKRIGITVGNNAKWLRSKARKTKSK